MKLCGNSDEKMTAAKKSSFIFKDSGRWFLQRSRRVEDLVMGVVLVGVSSSLNSASSSRRVKCVNNQHSTALNREICMQLLIPVCTLSLPEELQNVLGWKEP